MYDIAAFTMVRGIGGSVENRCLWELDGKPLLEWAIQPLKKSGRFDKIIVATESEEIDREATRCGAQVVRRPLDQVIDDDRDFNVGLEKRLKPRSFLHRRKHIVNLDMEYVLYCLLELEGYLPDILFSFSVDGPLGRPESIDRVIETFFENEYCSTVVTIYEVAPNFWMINPKDKKLFPIFSGAGIGLPRQSYPELYKSGIYNLSGSPGKMIGPEVFPFRYLKYDYVIVSPEESFHVHNKDDLFLAECYMKRRLSKIKMKGGEKNEEVHHSPNDSGSGNGGYSSSSNGLN